MQNQVKSLSLNDLTSGDEETKSMSTSDNEAQDQSDSIEAKPAEQASQFAQQEITTLEMATQNTLMPPNHDSLPEFNPGRDQTMYGAKWEAWLQVWTLYLESRELGEKENGEYKLRSLKPLFLLKLGDEARQIYNGRKKSDETDTLGEIIAFMSDHYKPKRSVFAYVSILYKAKRFEGESVNDYVARLRQLAKPCNFGPDLEKELLRAFVFGCGIAKVEEMMATHDNKSFKDALECGYKHEHQLEDLRQIRSILATGSPSAFVNNMFHNRSAFPPQQSSCGYCGKEQHARQQCPAKGKSCNKCGKEGHYGKVCRQTRDQTPQQTNQKKFPGVNRHARGSTRSGPAASINQISDTTPNAQNVSAQSREDKWKSGCLPRSGEGVHITLSEQQYDEYQRFVKATEWGDVFNMVLDSHETDPNTLTNVDINGTTVQVMVDTGAAANAINELTYNRLGKRPELDPLERSLYGFGNPEKPLRTLGEFKKRLRWNAAEEEATVVVMRGCTHQNLVGRRTAVALGMVTLNLGSAGMNQVEPKMEYSKEELLLLHPELFSGKLGCATDVEIKLEVDETIKPVKQPLRPIAFHYREAVERELEKQVAEGILEKVEFGTKPITWISNLVVVPKERASGATNGKFSKPTQKNPEKTYELAVRLTCDARPVNKALKRTRYPMKTIDDLVVAVNGATVISKLDLNKAFHQMKIAEESRPLTTITTHKGLYWYKRLHMGIASASEIFTEKIREMLADIPGQVNMTDDILVFGRSRKEHQSNLLAVLKRLEERGMTLNLEKSEFYKSELTFFGLRFTAHGISPTEDRVKAIRAASAPTNSKDLHSFLCSITWSSRFMKDVCTTAEPLWRLTKSGVKWQWGEAEQAASTKCVGYFNKDWCTVVTVDASPVGLGAVLHQYNPVQPSLLHLAHADRCRASLQPMRKGSPRCRLGMRTSLVVPAGQEFHHRNRQPSSEAHLCQHKIETTSQNREARASVIAI